MAKRDPARETALLTPDAVPARSDSTEVRTRVVNGAIARLMPSDSNRMGGEDVRPIGRVRTDTERHGASQGDDGAAGEQWQAPAEPAAEHAGERRDDRNQHLQGNEGQARHQRRQVRAPDHHERDQG